MKPTQIFTNGAPEYGICVVAYTRDSRGNHPGPGGKPAQYRSKTPPKGHTWFTHTTKNKVERLPSLRARATVPLSHTHAHTCMVPQRSCAVHGPARALGCPSALRHTATASNDSLAAATTFARSRRVALLRAYRNLTGAYPSSGSLACQAVAGWLASRRASSHPAVAHVPDLRQWRQPAVRARIARRSWAPVSLVAAMTRSARPKTRFQIRLRVHRR